MAKRMREVDVLREQIAKEKARGDRFAVTIEELRNELQILMAENANLTEELAERVLLVSSNGPRGGQ